MAGTTKEVTRRAAEGAGRWPGVPKAHAPPRRGASDSETGGDAGSGERNVLPSLGRHAGGRALDRPIFARWVRSPR